MKPLLLGAVLLVGCGPHWEYRCVQSHQETHMAYWPHTTVSPYGAGGIPVAGGEWHVVDQTVCDRQDSTWVGGDRP